MLKTTLLKHFDLQNDDDYETTSVDIKLHTCISPTTNNQKGFSKTRMDSEDDNDDESCYLEVAANC